MVPVPAKRLEICPDDATRLQPGCWDSPSRAKTRG